MPFQGTKTVPREEIFTTLASRFRVDGRECDDVIGHILPEFRMLCKRGYCTSIVLAFCGRARSRLNVEMPESFYAVVLTRFSIKGYSIY